MRMTIDQNAVKAKIEDAWKKGLPLLTSEVLRGCNEFCKLDKGGLRASAWSSSRFDEGVIVWNTPYARRQYYGIPTAYEPGTCWQWCEAAKGKYAAQWEEQAQRLMEMNL